jgi:hypothetical protein
MGYRFWRVQRYNLFDKYNNKRKIFINNFKNTFSIISENPDSGAIA